MAYICQIQFLDFQVAILVTFTYKNRHSGHLRGSITPTLVHTNQDQKNPYI